MDIHVIMFIVFNVIISSVLYNIMANEYVSEAYKDRLRVAARAGRSEGQCHVSIEYRYIYSLQYLVQILMLTLRCFPDI